MMIHLLIMFPTFDVDIVSKVRTWNITGKICYFDFILFAALNHRYLRVSSRAGMMWYQWIIPGRRNLSKDEVLI